MIGNKVIALENTGSTNHFAAALVESGMPDEGTVVIADYQEKGRGQRESVWESERGKNLLCSIILYPAFLPLSNQFRLNQAVSLAVVSLVEDLTGIKTHIKWPNDILVNEKKIAGILIENNLRGQTISSSIIGIGLNVNQLLFRNYSYAAVSLASLTGRNYNMETCARQLFGKLDWYYALLKNGDDQPFQDHYQEHLFRLDTPAMYEIHGKTVEAINRGINESGELILEFPDGSYRMIRTGDMKYLF